MVGVGAGGEHQPHRLEPALHVATHLGEVEVGELGARHGPGAEQAGADEGGRIDRNHRASPFLARTDHPGCETRQRRARDLLRPAVPLRSDRQREGAEPAGDSLASPALAGERQQAGPQERLPGILSRNDLGERNRLPGSSAAAHFSRSIKRLRVLPAEADRSFTNLL